ncbi:MAG TPA: hypothetical protein G4N96_04265 [Chloroflexi bacterium]|nr:MAG: hypothetical protein B6243_03550 [Anaerolineaceae bacterium 4572_5.2]HEY84314.1 hypothetical protein [Chloroflexota bacterium]
MKKGIFLALLTVFTLLACAGIGVGQRPDGNTHEIFATSTVWPLQNVQVNSGQILPPYGVKVAAETVLLQITVSVTDKEAADNLQTLQSAVTHIANLASENNQVQLESASVNQIANSARGSIEKIVTNSYNLNSSITLELVADLSDQTLSLIDALIIFDEFLDTVKLPDTVTLHVLSAETRIANPEMYRQQLVAQVYDELDAVKADYGSAVTFEVTGLHDSLQVMRLNDTEYYIYLKPNIITKEF